MKILTALQVFILLLLMKAPVFAQAIPPYSVTVNTGNADGYFYVCPFKMGANPLGITPSLMIIDSDGELVYYRTFIMGSYAGDFKIHDNGLMSYNRLGQFFLMDSTFTIVDSVSCQNGVNTDTHDLQILPDGNFLLMGIEDIIMDLSSYFVFGPSMNPGSTTATVKSIIVQELDTAKNVVFQWHASSHFNFIDVDPAWLYNPNLVDWTHSNSVEQDADSNILISSRHFNEITKINRQTGNIMWRMGGSANQFNFVNDPMMLKRQHDARWLPNGNLSVFDNGDGLSGNYFHHASAKEYQIDEPGMSATLVWSYTDDSTEHSQSMGNFQRNPGGLSLINYGNSATQNKLFSLVNESGIKEFEIVFPDDLCSYRAFYYESLPWNVNRPQITCSEVTGQAYLDAGAGFASYEWSNGAVTQTIPITATGLYYVTVPLVQGGVMRSKSFQVFDLADPCGLSGIEELNTTIISARPNPVSDMLHIYIQSNQSSALPVNLYNTAGQLVYSAAGSNEFHIPVYDLENGIYYIRYQESVLKVVVAK